MLPFIMINAGTEFGVLDGRLREAALAGVADFSPRDNDRPSPDVGSPPSPTS